MRTHRLGVDAASRQARDTQAAAHSEEMSPTRHERTRKIAVTSDVSSPLATLSGRIAAASCSLAAVVAMIVLARAMN
jgi:hypothetical protein